MKFLFGAALLFVLAGCALVLPSTAAAGPTSAVLSPKYLSFINMTSFTNSYITVTGVATTDTGTLSKVEVAVNGGENSYSWKRATGTTNWSYKFQVRASGIYQIQSRATDSLSNEETPGPGVVVDVVLPSATGSISGNVSYSGLKGGDFLVAAFTDKTLPGANPIVYTNIGGTPGGYTLSPLPPGTFYVGSIKTVVGPDGTNTQPNDPVGAYGSVTAPAPIKITMSGNQVVTGKNITLNDTSTNPLFLPAHVQALYAYWGNVAATAMRIAFEFNEPDPGNPASSVTVTGPKIVSPISLVYDSSKARWVSTGVNNSPDISLFLTGTPDTWPTLPATYTFTVTGEGGAGTRTSSVKTYLTDMPKMKSPFGGDVYGSVVFSWDPVPGASFYEAELWDQGSSFHWHSNMSPDTFYKYDGSPLTDGHTYTYAVIASDLYDSGAVGLVGSFIYHASTDTTAPSSTINSPSDSWKVSGDWLMSSGVSGTALDDAAGTGVERVEISLDGGTNWFGPATDTSLLHDWSTWNAKWPAPGPPANIPLLNIKCRAVDGANNYETPSAGINVTVDITIPTAAFTYPANNAYVTTLAPTITGTATDPAAGSPGTGVASVWFSPGNNDWRGPADGVTDTSGNGSWSTWSYLWHVPADGLYTIITHAVDNAGNQPLAQDRTSINVIVDTTPPVTTITAPADGAYFTTVPVTITGTASDATSGMAKVEISTNNGSTWTTLAATATSDNWAHWSYTWTPPADGVYTIKSRGTDKAGNVESVFTVDNTKTITVDRAKPAVAITAPLSAAWVPGSSFTITGTASDATSGVAKVEVSIDGGVWTSVTGTTSWSYSWNPLPADGTHKLQAKATDKAGNFQTTAVISVKVDGHAPTSTITAPAGGATLNTATYVIKGTAADTGGSGVKKVDISVDGGSTFPYTATGTTAWSFTWTLPSTPGSATIKTRATDIAGNVETPGAGVMVTVDKTMPASVITAPVNGKALKGASATVTGTAAAGASGGTVTKVEVRVINADTSAVVLDWTQATGTTAWSYTWALPADGNYTLLSRATNSGPHTEDTSLKAGTTVTVDNTQPATAITAPAGGAVLKGATYTITGTASDSGSGLAKVECGITVGTSTATTWYLATGTSSWSYKWTLPADGPYTLKARGTDKAGNVQTLSIPAVSVRVDKTAPTIAIAAPANGFIVPAPLSNYSITGYPVTGTAADGATGSGVKMVEVSTDGGSTWSPATGTTSWSYAWMLPADGSYTIKARSKDNSDNVSAAMAGNTVKVDGTSPIALLTQPDKNAILNGTSYVIKGTASDNPGGSGVKKVEIAIDGGARVLATGTTSWSYTWSLTNVSYGSHLIQYWVTDNAGNQSGEYDRSVTVDKTSPVSAITAPTAGKAIKGATATVTGTATAGVSGGTVTKVEVRVSNADTSAVVLDWTQATGTTAWSYTWALPADGNYTLLSRATNSGPHTEDTSLKAGTTVTVDNTQPATAITAPAGGAVLKGATVPITGTADDGTGSGVAKVEVSTNNGSTWVAATGTVSWSYNWTLGADGPYTIKARSTDKAGNVQTLSIPSVSVRIDKTKPTSAITSPATGANLGNGASKTITGTASDGATGSGVDLVEVGVTPTTPAGSPTTWYTATDTSGAGTWATWNYVWTLPPDGSYNIKTRATDNSNNVQTPGTGNTVKVDNSPPTVAISTPTDGSTITGTGTAALARTVTGSSSDGGSGLSKVEVSFDDGTNWKLATGTTSWTCAWTITTTATTGITARATDKAGNTNTDAHSVTVSPKLFTGTWSYTFTPVGGGTANSGTVPITVDDAGNATINVPNKCHSVYTGTFTGMTAALVSNNEEDNAGTCTATGYIELTFKDMRHATGEFLGPDGITVLAELKLSR
jgi:hypothetical protein